MELISKEFFEEGLRQISLAKKIKEIPSSYSIEIGKVFMRKSALMYSRVVTRIVTEYDGFGLPTLNVWRGFLRAEEDTERLASIKPKVTKAIDYHGDNQVVIDRTQERFMVECPEHVPYLVVNGNVVTIKQHEASRAYFGILVQEYASVHGEDLLGGLGFGVGE